MKNKIKIMMAGVLVAVLGVAIASPVSADLPYRCVNGKLVSKPADCDEFADHAGDPELVPTVTGIINVIIGIVGFLAVLMIIIGGITYTTSAGDPGKVKKAKDTIMYGIIGLVVALLAFAIVNFVLTSL